MNGHDVAGRLLNIAKSLMTENEFDLDPLAMDVAQFIASNPNPTDEDFHSWAKDAGYNEHEAEAAAYRIVTIFTKFLFGGYANEEEFGEQDADPEELSMGIEVEKEHTPDIMTAKRIALDHLAETSDAKLQYYTLLAIVEKIAERSIGMTDEEAERVLERLKSLIKE